MRDEIEIAGREVKFFVVARVVGDVHLAVAVDDFARLVDDGGGVVINAGRAPLEDRCDDNYFPRLGDGAERFGRRSGNRLGQIEEFRVLGLTRVMRAEQLLRADYVRAAFGGLLDFRDRLVEIEARLRRTTHLDEPDDDLVSVRCHDNCDSNRASPTLSSMTVDSNARAAPGRDWQRAALALTALVLIGALYSMRLRLLETLTIDPDEFEHLHVAWCMANGLVPYRDFFEHHTPWLHFLIAPFFRFYAVAGDPDAAIAFIFFARRIAMVLAGVAIALTFLLARLWRGEIAGWMSAVLLSTAVVFV